VTGHSAQHALMGMINHHESWCRIKPVMLMAHNTIQLSTPIGCCLYFAKPTSAAMTATIDSTSTTMAVLGCVFVDDKAADKRFAWHL
jgi:hypothetical protein